MRVTLTHEEVLEACREWLDRHYGIKPGEGSTMRATLTGPANEGRVFDVTRIEVVFADAPKPSAPYRSNG